MAKPIQRKIVRRVGGPRRSRVRMGRAAAVMFGIIIVVPAAVIGFVWLIQRLTE